MPRNRSSSPDEHLETDHELFHRIQDQITADSWQGVDTVGARSTPITPATIHDMTPDEDEMEHIYNWGPKKAGF